MAIKDRSSAADITKALETDHTMWSFFQAVEFVQTQLDEGREVGTHQQPADEKLMFGVASSLSFPTSDINTVNRSPDLPRDAEGLPIQIDVTFLGLHGANSPLPSFYTETIASYDKNGSVLKDFLDFFHNRIIGFLHRSMRKYRYYVRYRPDADDIFSKHVFSLFGVNDERMREGTSINWPRLLTFAGALSTRNRSPKVVAGVIQHAFFLKQVEIEEWVLRKVDVPKNQKWLLGVQNTTLAEDAVVGDRVPSLASKFRIHIKDLDFERFQDFLPSGKDFAALGNLMAFMLRDQAAYDLKLGLIEGESVPVELTADAPNRLGWSSFLGEGQNAARDVLIAGRR